MTQERVALINVHDGWGIAPIVKELSRLGYRIITHTYTNLGSFLREMNLPWTPIGEVDLARAIRTRTEQNIGVPAINLVIVNFAPAGADRTDPGDDQLMESMADWDRVNLALAAIETRRLVLTDPSQYERFKRAIKLGPRFLEEWSGMARSHALGFVAEHLLEASRAWSKEMAERGGLKL